MVRISGFHPDDPGSIPGKGTTFAVWVVSLTALFCKGELKKCSPVERLCFGAFCLSCRTKTATFVPPRQVSPHPTCFPPFLQLVGLSGEPMHSVSILGDFSPTSLERRFFFSGKRVNRNTLSDGKNKLAQEKR